MIRYILIVLGYIMAVIDLVMMVSAPWWNLHVTNLRIKEIIKNR